MTFFPDYFAARNRFRRAAAAAGARLEAHPIAARGPKGEVLSIDVALLGPESPSATLLLSSGLHGVEGFFGSAVQTAWLEERERPPLPDGLRVVLIHALNPYGFAHLRRFNEDNVDPNRNFLLEGEAYRGCPEGYPPLDPVLNPKYPPGRCDPFVLRALVAIARQGYATLKQAIAAGQYEYPRGIFFGGRGPIESNRLLAAHLTRWAGDAPRLLHLDFHTGLGRWGGCRLLIDDVLSEAETAWMADHFGRNSFELSHAAGVAYQNAGGLGEWCLARFRGRDYTYLCAEFGTYSSLKVLARIRAENMAHHWGRPDDPSTLQAKLDLLEAFRPASREWRDKVTARGLDLVHRAVAALRDPVPAAPHG